MFKGKIKITTILLLIVTLFLLGSTIYIGKLITTDEGGASTVAPQKSKATNVTYSKLIVLNSTPSQPEATTIPEVTERSETPTPTEIVLAYNNPTITGEATSETEISATVSSTMVKDLPDAGSIANGLIIFAGATLLIFFSFLF